MKHIWVTDCHGMNIAVKVALNLNTTNQPTSSVPPIIGYTSKVSNPKTLPHTQKKKTSGSTCTVVRLESRACRSRVQYQGSKLGQQSANLLPKNQICFPAK